MTLTKKILLSSFAAAMAFSGASFATTPGFYLGAQAGMSNTNPPTATGISIDGKGAAFGLRAGYQFDKNWAVEGGYTRFANTKLTVTGLPLTATATLNVFDIVGKGTYDFNNGVGIYAKAGIAFLRSSASANFAGNTFNLGRENATRPTAGVGVKYDINQNVSVDFGINRIFKGGKLDRNADTYMFGVTYNFG